MESVEEHSPEPERFEYLSIPFVAASSYPVRGGNLVRHLIDGEPAFSRICEAIDAAHHSVWVTITFMWASFRMPGGRGTALEVLGRAAARGLDVRVIFWRPDRETDQWRANAFWGAEEHFSLLEDVGRTIRVRWDRAEPGFCQHQKSWLIDAGTSTESAFVGGLNLNPNSMVAPGHCGAGQNHDAYIELAGPSAVDVHHNFIQRWNEASERETSGGRWGSGSEEPMPFPTEIPASRGEAVAQVQRTIHAGRYSNDHPTPGGRRYPIHSGERSNLEQYCAAIGAAGRSIYIENQCVTVDQIVQGLRSALQRGVDVVLVMPAAGVIPAHVAALEIFGNFTLAGLAGIGPDGKRNPVWVHDKLMLVDGAWATVGSCNLHHASLFGNSELNVAFWDPATVRALRIDLLFEHLGRDTSHLDDRAALRLFRTVARANRRKFDAGENAWEGLAFHLSPSPPGSLRGID
jgi:phosphatidylserine/phosphatidylglycerophosphate/cardiolipin synthase-like enzyme